MDIVRRKLMLVSIGTSRVKAIFLELTRQRDPTFDPSDFKIKGAANRVCKI